MVIFHCYVSSPEGMGLSENRPIGYLFIQWFPKFPLIFPLKEVKKWVIYAQVLKSSPEQMLLPGDQAGLPFGSCRHAKSATAHPIFWPIFWPIFNATGPHENEFFSPKIDHCHRCPKFPLAGGSIIGALFTLW